MCSSLAMYGFLNNIFQHKISIFGNLGSSRVKSAIRFETLRYSLFNRIQEFTSWTLSFFFFRSGVKSSSDTKEFTVSIPGKGNAVFNMEKKVKCSEDLSECSGLTIQFPVRSHLPESNFSFLTFLEISERYEYYIRDVDFEYKQSLNDRFTLQHGVVIIKFRPCSP